MSLESDLHHWFVQHGWTWNIKGGEAVTPDEFEIEMALDEAAKILEDHPVGTKLEVGRLIIEKRSRDYDVYVYAGRFY